MSTKTNSTPSERIRRRSLIEELNITGTSTGSSSSDSFKSQLTNSSTISKATLAPVSSYDMINQHSNQLSNQHAFSFTEPASRSSFSSDISSGSFIPNNSNTNTNTNTFNPFLPTSTREQQTYKSPNWLQSARLFGMSTSEIYNNNTEFAISDGEDDLDFKPMNSTPYTPVTTGAYSGFNIMPPISPFPGHVGLNMNHFQFPNTTNNNNSTPGRQQIKPFAPSFTPLAQQQQQQQQQQQKESEKKNSEIIMMAKKNNNKKQKDDNDKTPETIRNKSKKNSKNAKHIYRSPKLEEFRSNMKNKNYKLMDFKGFFVEFSYDQHGSRFIQQELTNASPKDITILYNELSNDISKLMIDVFGNYIIQKFFQFAPEEIKLKLLNEMFGKIKELSLQMYGCRVIQKSIEYLSIQSILKIIKELNNKDDIMTLVLDQNGNHVIQKLIEKLPFENLKFIHFFLKGHYYKLATHSYGCRVIQRLLEFSTIDIKIEILNELMKFIFYLIQDQFGNYVIQHIIQSSSSSSSSSSINENKNENEIEIEIEKDEVKTITNIVLKSILNFSKHKYASNVVEKCIIYGTNDDREKIIDTVLKRKNLNDNVFIQYNNDEEIELNLSMPLIELINDQFANYVMQKLIENTKTKKRNELVFNVKLYLKYLNDLNPPEIIDVTNDSSGKDETILAPTLGKNIQSIEKLVNSLDDLN